MGKYFLQCAPVFGGHCFQKIGVEFHGLQSMNKTSPQKFSKLAQKHLES